MQNSDVGIASRLEANAIKGNAIAISNWKRSDERGHLALFLCVGGLSLYGPGVILCGLMLTVTQDSKAQVAGDAHSHLRGTIPIFCPLERSLLQSSPNRAVGMQKRKETHPKQLSIAPSN